VQATYVGKPNPFVFDLALRSLGLPEQEVLVVGDRVATDVLGAHNSGLRAALIKSGEFAIDDLRSAIQPDYGFDEIGGLLSLFGG
jgi:ribonucleotide monophosphatase NagD (HAD superfamily)